LSIETSRSDRSTELELVWFIPHCVQEPLPDTAGSP
jgi:hypothetical protein